jgi:hypothetical protein
MVYCYAFIIKAVSAMIIFRKEIYNLIHRDLILCSNLLDSGGVVKTYGFFNDSSHATHYLKFSVKITTNQLHYYFRNRVPYLEKEVSRFELEAKDLLN